MSVSMIVWSNACPMCSEPVTFGGGIMMQYGLPLPRGSKYPACSHSRYSDCSSACGSKLLSILLFVGECASELCEFVLEDCEQPRAQIVDAAVHHLDQPVVERAIDAHLQRLVQGVH